MVDASVAFSVRERIAQQTGSVATAERLVPQAPSEARYAALAAELRSALPVQLPTANAAARSGPFGLPTVFEAQQVVAQLQAAYTRTYPRLQVRCV